MDNWKFNFKYSNVIIVLICLIYKINAFNLSPQPNIVINEPASSLKTGMPKTRSSYFGFTINLKHNRLVTAQINMLFIFYMFIYL